MNKESLVRKENHLFIPLSVLGLFTIASLSAFTKKARREILERDGYRSVKSGKKGNLEASHIDHSRKNPKYNDPSNGRMLTTREHYIDHYDRHERNGLPAHQNKWSLRVLWGKLSGKQRRGLNGPETVE